jgi:hypothetical protein
MRLVITFGVLVAGTMACRETRSITSSEVSEAASSSDLRVSTEEAERVLAQIVAMIEAGEDLTPAMTRLIQVAMADKGPDYKWQGLVLDKATTIRLEAKYQAYRAKLPEALDTYGFVPGCDGLLFTGLMVAAGESHNLYQAESPTEPGRWDRSAEHDCFSSGRSASTISRDMIMGLASALWKTEDGPAVQRILAYSARNRGILGQAKDSSELLGRATMSPSLLSILSEIDYRTTGTNSPSRGYFPEFGRNLRGFEAHLQVLSILLKASLYGGILRTDFKVIETLYKREPRNALFSAVYHGFIDGDGREAAQALSDLRYFPAGALPSSAERCEPYLWQRVQDSSDWLPCPQKRETFAAVDFFVVYALLANKWKF